MANESAIVVVERIVGITFHKGYRKAAFHVRVQHRAVFDDEFSGVGIDGARRIGNNAAVIRAVGRNASVNKIVESVGSLDILPNVAVFGRLPLISQSALLCACINGDRVLIVGFCKICALRLRVDRRKRKVYETDGNVFGVGVSLVAVFGARHLTAHDQWIGVRSFTGDRERRRVRICKGITVLRAILDRLVKRCAFRIRPNVIPLIGHAVKIVCVVNGRADLNVITLDFFDFRGS